MTPRTGWHRSLEHRQDDCPGCAAVAGGAAANERAFYSPLVGEAFDNGRRAALEALRSEVEGMPMTWDQSYRAVSRDERLAAAQVSRASILAAIARALEEAVNHS
jgi:hypothetical protein